MPAHCIVKFTLFLSSFFFFSGMLDSNGRRRSIVEIHAEKVQEAKNMSIFEAKMARAFKKKQQKKWKQERNSLGSFVKYIDYQLVTTLVKMCENDVYSLQLLCHEKERVGLFETTVRFNKNAAPITFQQGMHNYISSHNLLTIMNVWCLHY